MHLLHESNGMGKKIIKPKFKTSVLFWDHDNKLQEHKVFVNGSEKSVFVHIWRAICDERLKSIKPVVFFLTRLKKPEGFEHDSTVKCFNGQNPISHLNYTLQYCTTCLGSTFFCPFERTQTCPRTISIQFGDQIITNEIAVERLFSSDERNRERNQSLITVCCPAITAKMGSFDPYRYKYDRWVPRKKTIGSLDDSLKLENIIGVVLDLKDKKCHGN